MYKYDYRTGPHRVYGLIISGSNHYGFSFENEVHIPLWRKECFLFGRFPKEQNKNIEFTINTCLISFLDKLSIESPQKLKVINREFFFEPEFLLFEDIDSTFNFCKSLCDQMTESLLFI